MEPENENTVFREEDAASEARSEIYAITRMAEARETLVRLLVGIISIQPSVEGTQEVAHIIENIIARNYDFIDALHARNEYFSSALNGLTSGAIRVEFSLHHGEPYIKNGGRVNGAGTVLDSEKGVFEMDD